MHTVSRVFIRSITAALCALALTLALAAVAPATTTTVQLRIEAPGETVFNGAVATGARNLPNTAASACSPDGGSATAAFATPTTAAADWADGAGTGFLSQYGGTYPCRIDGYVNGTGGFFMMKINNRTQASPGNYLTGGSELSGGDSVLWYFTDDYAQPTFDLVLPSTAGVGQTVTGRVDQFDSGDDTQTPGAGAAVGGGDASATSGADGLFTISFATPGHYLISATKSGVVRGSAWIDVSAAPAALPAIAPVRINRFATCASHYGKGSPKHRRCIRIVRNKQRAECRGANARVTAHCQKVLARFKSRRR